MESRKHNDELIKRKLADIDLEPSKLNFAKVNKAYQASKRKSGNGKFLWFFFIGLGIGAVFTVLFLFSPFGKEAGVAGNSELAVTTSSGETNRRNNAHVQGSPPVTAELSENEAVSAARVTSLPENTAAFDTATGREESERSEKTAGKVNGSMTGTVSAKSEKLSGNGNSSNAGKAGKTSAGVNAGVTRVKESESKQDAVKGGSFASAYPTGKNKYNDAGKATTNPLEKTKAIKEKGKAGEDEAESASAQAKVTEGSGSDGWSEQEKGTVSSSGQPKNKTAEVNSNDPTPGAVSTSTLKVPTDATIPESYSGGNIPLAESKKKDERDLKSGVEGEQDSKPENVYDRMSDSVVASKAATDSSTKIAGAKSSSLVAAGASAASPGTESVNRHAFGLSAEVDYCNIQNMISANDNAASYGAGFSGKLMEAQNPGRSKLITGSAFFNYAYKGTFGVNAGASFFSVESLIDTKGFEQVKTSTLTTFVTDSVLVDSTWQQVIVDTIYSPGPTRNYVIVNGDSVESQSYSCNIRFISIPFNFSYRFPIGRRFSIEPHLGIQYLIPLRSYQLVATGPNAFEYSRSKMFLKRSLSYDASIQFNCRLNQKASLYIRQGYYFNRSSVYESSYPIQHRFKNIYSAFGLAVWF